MSSATPQGSQSQHSRSASRTRASTPPPLPTTPLRPPSRSSLRSSHTPTHGGTLPSASSNPIETLEPAFAELSDGMADLEANFMHLQLMHESLARFNECFASFLHGMKVNAFCVDFPEAPGAESWKRAAEKGYFERESEGPNMSGFGAGRADDDAVDPDQTFLTTDTSFVENPPASSMRGPPSSNVSRLTTPARGRGIPTTGARAGRQSAAGTTRGSNTARGRPSGLARATNRGRGAYR